MSSREVIRASRDGGTLLETVAATPYDQLDEMVEALSALHNEGKIDLLIACGKPGLATLSTRSFFGLQRVFCRTLPRLQCTTKDAVDACERMFERAGSDGAASFVFDALVKWLEQKPERAVAGLELVEENPDMSANVVRSVLLGGVRHDPAKSTDDALDLSNREQPNVRLPALWALARVLPDDNEGLLVRTLRRLTDVAADDLSDRDTAAAVDSALHLYSRMGKGIREPVESIVTNACRAPGPVLRQALAHGLAVGGTVYSDTMIDQCLSALGRTQGGEAGTLQTLDGVLYGWDLDRDRKRILRLLVDLSTQEDGTFDLGSLDSFQHKLREADGELLGWYAVSLLLTGRHSVCDAVLGLLPHTGQRDGLDIDLRPFALSPRRVLFLAKKILGYCFLKKECAAALLLSCLRVVAAANRRELEDLVLEHFLMNYPSAIDWLRAATPRGHPAKGSVDSLARRLGTYLTNLERAGTCLAFAPTETQRLLQRYKFDAFFRSVHKEAQQGSALLQIIPKAHLLYGTGSVFYAQLEPESKPVRREMAFSTFKQQIEFPRLEQLDPLGLQRDTWRFRAETDPG